MPTPKWLVIGTPEGFVSGSLQGDTDETPWATEVLAASAINAAKIAHNKIHGDDDHEKYRAFVIPADSVQRIDISPPAGPSFIPVPKRK